MWIAFNDKRKYRDGDYTIVFDGIRTATATCRNNKWFSVNDEHIDKQEIFYVDIPDEPVRYAVFNESDMFAENPKPVQYSYYTPLVVD